MDLNNIDNQLSNTHNNKCLKSFQLDKNYDS